MGERSGDDRVEGDPPVWLGELAAADRHRLEELCELLRNPRQENLVLPVVGAGLSQPALPSWVGLLRELVGLLPSDQQSDFSAELEHGDLLNLASVLVRRLEGGAISLRDHLERRFGSEALLRRKLERPSVHDRAAALGPTQILTTNYDPWIHAALAERLGRPPRKLVPKVGNPFASFDPGAGPFVMFLHGDADDAATCVLTQEQYDDLQFDGRGYVEGLSALCLQRRLLFLGQSARDPDLAWVLQRGRTLLGSSLRHFLIGFDLSSFERERLIQRGIAPVQVGHAGQYERLEQLLAWIARPATVESETVRPRSQPRPRASMRVPPAPRSPFPGLRTYTEEDADLFFGREADAEDVINELSRRLGRGQLAWLQLEGASGMGKSSLAHAGILPLVRRGRLDEQAHPWIVAKWRPGLEPLRSLAFALHTALDLAEPTENLEARLRRNPDALRNLLDEQFVPAKPRARLLLLADQLEELFTLHPPALGDESKGQKARAGTDSDLSAIETNLSAALRTEPCRFVLLSTIRRDFEGELRRLPKLDELLPQAYRKTLLPVHTDALAQGMTRVAEAFGLRWDPSDLPARLAEEAAALPVGLPLLASALEGLWADPRRPHDELTDSSQRWMTLGGALGVRAEEVFRKVADLLGEREAEERLRALFLALVRPGQGTRDTRKLVPRSEVLRAAGGDDTALELLSLVSGANNRFWPEQEGRPPYLVAVGSSPAPDREELVELAHERLLVDWGRLAQDWLPPHRERLAWRDQLEAVAELWKRAGSDPRAVDVGPLFDRYEAAGSTNAAATDYLSAGRRRRRRRTLQRRSLLAVCFVSLLGFVVTSKNEAHRSAVDAEIQAALRAFEPNWRLTLLAELREVRQGAQVEAIRIRWSAYLALAAEAGRRSVAGGDSAEDRWRRDSAEDLRTALDSDGKQLKLWIDLLADLARRWEQVRAGLNGMEPAFDLFPLLAEDLRSGARDASSTRKFVLVGSGDLPRWRHPPDCLGVGGGPCKPGCPLLEVDADAETGIVFDYVPGGTFTMGALYTEGNRPDEQPPHEVPLGGFLLALHELTSSQRSRLSPPSGVEDKGALPLTMVDWTEASAFCESLGLRLPTEAQWEYACRAGSSTRYSSGSDESSLDAVAWYGENSEGQLHNVGQKRSNAWGLFDMHGNAWEWCQDSWSADYSKSRRVHPAAYESSGSPSRVLRGGSFGHPAELARSAFRFSATRGLRRGDLGFRPARRITTH